MKQYAVKKVDLPSGETLAYRTAGTMGPVVVLIHGNNSSSVHWQTTMEQLEHSHQVYAVDMRGFGDSSYHQEFNSIHELACDIKQFIDLLELKEFYLVGWSAGGPVAMEIAADWPDRVKGLTLLCTGALSGFPFPIKAGEVMSKGLIGKNKNVRMLYKAQQKGKRRILRMVCNMTLYHLNKPEKEEYEQYIDAICKQRCLLDINYALITFNMTHDDGEVAKGSGRVDLVKCPITVIHADQDKIIPLAWSQAIKDLFGDQAKLVILEGLGHSPVTDDLDQVVAVLRDSFV